jgi:hypothetical protein
MTGLFNQTTTHITMNQITFYSESLSFVGPMIAIIIGVLMVVSARKTIGKGMDISFSFFCGVVFILGASWVMIDGSFGAHRQDAILTSILSGPYDIKPAIAREGFFDLRPTKQEMLNVLGKSVPDTPGKIVQLSKRDLIALDAFIKGIRPDLTSSWTDNTSKLALMASK